MLRSISKRQIYAAFTHKCELTHDQDNLLPVPAPYASFFHKCCFHLRCYLTIDQTYESRNYFRSNASFIKEKLRHLSTREYAYTIHPLSCFAIREQVFMTFVWIVLFILSPLTGSFYANKLLRDEVFELKLLRVLTLDLMIWLDCFMRFFLGYIIPQTREIVLDRKRIAKHYIKTYFVIDVVPPFLNLMLLFVTPLTFRGKLLIYPLILIRLGRMKSIGEGVSKILRHFKVGDSIRETFVLYVLCLLAVHWWTCSFKYINMVRKELRIPFNESWLEKVRTERIRTKMSNYAGGTGSAMFDDSSLLEYLNYMQMVFCHFFGAGVGNYKSNDSLEMFLLSMLLIFSLVIYVFTLAILLQNFGINISESKFEEIITQAKDHMVVKRYPPSLRRRIRQYYNYKFNKKYFAEEKIMESLSEHLQMEVLLYSCRNMVDKVQLFRGLSKAAVGCILALLNQEIFLSGDVIMHSDDETGTLYFILFGTCAVKLVSGKEAMHIEDGSHFGENRDFSRDIQQDFLYTVVALEACEIYSLSREDSLYCCKHYPEITQKLEVMCTWKARQYNNILAQAAADEEAISATDIIAALRLGRILDHGRRRLQPLT